MTSPEALGWCHIELLFGSGTIMRWTTTEPENQKAFELITKHFGLPDTTKVKGVKRHRGPRNEAAGGAKLTERKVLNIRHAAARGTSKKVLAYRYGVHPTTISQITLGYTWKDVGGPITDRHSLHRRHNSRVDISPEVATLDSNTQPLGGSNGSKDQGRKLHQQDPADRQARSQGDHAADQPRPAQDGQQGTGSQEHQSVEQD